MKRVPISIAASVLCVTTIFIIPKPKTFTGQIMDSQCAEMGGHSILNPLS